MKHARSEDFIAAVPVRLKSDLRHVDTTMKTLTGKDRFVSAGDTAVWVSDSSGNWRELDFTPATLVPGKNYVDNPSFNNWQRATSFALAAATRTAVADRWKAYRTNTGLTISRQSGFAVTGSTSSPKYCLRLARNNGVTSTNEMRLWHQLHEFSARGLAGQYVTLSFDVRAGANYSGGNVIARIHTGTAGSQAADLSLGTAGAFATGGAATAVSNSVVPTTTAQRLTCTPLLLGASVADLAIQISYNPTGTAGAADYIEITNVKLESGAVATPFQPPDEQADRDACLYTFQLLGLGLIAQAISSSTIFVQARFSTMRAEPGISLSTAEIDLRRHGAALVTSSGSTIPISSASGEVTHNLEVQIDGFSGLTTNNFGYIATPDVLQLDAELLL